MTGVTKEIIQCNEREKACWLGPLYSVEQSAVVIMMHWLLPQTEGPRNLSLKMLVPGESDQRVDAYVWGFGKRLHELSLVILSLE